MKHYLNKFENQLGYTNAVMGANTEFSLPSVSLIDNSHEVKYAPLFNPKYLYSDLTTSRVLNSSKTVIGVEVIPKSHSTDGKSRYVSVKNMSRSNPEAGSVETGNNDSNSAGKIPWGNSTDSISEITSYQFYGYPLNTDQGVVTEDNPFGIINELSENYTAVGANVVTDVDNGLGNNNYPFFKDTFLSGYANPSGETVINVPLPYPFNADGTKNLLYWNNGEGMAITDMNGTGNTMTLINRIDIEGWQIGTLNITVSDNTISEIKNHPAAAACYRFNPASSNTAHQWYLPSIGELGYLWANIAKINAKIDTLTEGQGIKIGVMNSQAAPINSLGKSIWSSSISEKDNRIYTFLLDTEKGYFMKMTAAYNASSYRVRAFIAI